MRQRTFVLLVGFLTVFLFSAFSTYGEAAVEPPAPGTYYVDISNGTDDYPGYGTSPGTGAWQTLHYAIQQINSGSTGIYILNVGAGTYDISNEADESLTISQSNLTVQGAGPGSTILDGTDAESWTPGIETSNASNVIIKDMEIRNFNCYGISMSAGSGNIIQGCEIHNNVSGGINIVNSSPGIKQNKIYDNPCGIYVTDSGGSASPDIWNNLIYDTGVNSLDSGIYLYSEGVMSVNPNIYHNTIDGGSSSGIKIYESPSGGSANPEIKYNIITNFNQYGLYAEGGYGGSPIIDYNNVWSNGGGTKSDNYNVYSPGANDLYDSAPGDGIGKDPLYAGYGLASGSPCIDAIPTTDPPGDPVDTDFLGYTRPKGSGYDMGAYEYVSDIAHNYNLPGGTGQVTDYRMFTIPVYVGTGSNMKTTMESYVGAYDKYKWRVFGGYDGSSYIEMDATGFSSLAVGPGDAFWAISLATEPTIQFAGRPAPDGEHYTMPLNQGWNIFGLPWPTTFDDIELGRIAVSDGVNNYWITSSSNTLTQKSVWDYTGTGPSNGYVQLTADTDVLKAGSGYWIKVESTLPVELLIPPDNGGGYFSALSLKTYTISSTSGDSGEEPPPPPGRVSSEFTGVENTAKGSCFIATTAE